MKSDSLAISHTKSRGWWVPPGPAPDGEAYCILPYRIWRITGIWEGKKMNGGRRVGGIWKERSQGSDGKVRGGEDYGEGMVWNHRIGQRKGEAT